MSSEALLSNFIPLAGSGEDSRINCELLPGSPYE